MKPPYTVTSQIIKLVSNISLKLGEVKANYLGSPSPQLRKSNRVKTIHSSLHIEGNTLSLEQVTALIDNKRVIGHKKDVTEVLNAIAIYKSLSVYEKYNERSFLQAHKLLMKGLISSPGKYRTASVGITKGDQLNQVAPPASNVTSLMKNLFSYLRSDDEILLIKSAVFHYELEFIYSFADGNGRMGRLWQTVLLLSEFPIFEYLPFETLISSKQNEYYEALSKSDKAGNSTAFIEFMLGVIDESLAQSLQYKSKIMTSLDRIDYYLSLRKEEFSRKDFMNVFKDISSATASRDLTMAIRLKKITQTGTKNTTKYKIR